VIHTTNYVDINGDSGGCVCSKEYQLLDIGSNKNSFCLEFVYIIDLKN